MICHGVVYSPDVFRISALPDESIREILLRCLQSRQRCLPEGAAHAQVVLTCTPFDPNNHTEKMNAAFLENQEKYVPFELAATFDMGNGYTITPTAALRHRRRQSRHLPRLSGRGERAVPLQFRCCLGRAGRANRK